MRRLIVLGLLALAACGSKEESTTIGGTTYTSNDKDNTATITTDKGSISTVTGPAAAAKAKLPAYAPQYPGSTIESAIDTVHEGRKSSIVTLTTKDGAKQVAEFYRAKFAGAGLKSGMDMVSDEGGMIGAESGGNKASVMVSHEDGKTSVVLTFSAS